MSLERRLRGVALVHRPDPVGEVVAWCEHFLAATGDWPGSTALMLATLAWTEAILGHFADARRHVSEGHVSLRELGLRHQEGMHAVLAGYVETAASDPVAAASWFERPTRSSWVGQRWFG